MQPIESPPVPFYTITINFILSLPTSVKGFDMAMPVIYKFIKRIIVVSGKLTWTAKEWAKALLN